MPSVMTAPASTILTHAADGVGWVTLNRPRTYNAITTELARALEQALVDIAEDVNVIVIRGAGGNFSVGGDFKELERLRAQGEQAMHELFESFGRACAVIEQLPVPVIAAVEGYALAGGFELMQACDLAVACEESRIGDNHSNFSQVPGGGSSQRLPRLVGRQRALGLILTGDHLSGTEAVAWGLAYRAAPAAEFEATVTQLATWIAGKSREALSRAKRLVYGGLELALTDGLALEVKTVLEHLSGAAAGAGIDGFVGGRDVGA
jgi:enoyl-CoA hydratase/carnithine racemase